MSQDQASPKNTTGGLIEEFGGSVVNMVLGGLLLWVGQTTFEHNGELVGVHQQVESMSIRHENLQDRHDQLLKSLNDRTRDRFTAEHGEKLSERIDLVQLCTQSLREQSQDRLAEIRVQVSALQVQIQSSPFRLAYSDPATAQKDMQQIHDEMANLRSEVTRMSRVLNAPAGNTTLTPRQASYRIHSQDR